MKRVVVVGAGPAGMMAAIAAAEHEGSVLLLEKMPRAGRKMMITGKGRCNVTSADDPADIIKNIAGNGRFLNSVIRAFDNAAVMAFFENVGVPLKTERGNRVFPQSDRAVDVVDAMMRRLRDLHVELRTNTHVRALVVTDGAIRGVRLESGDMVAADAIVLAVGGASYPLTGSTGDGYAMARDAGHHIVPIFPALVPLCTAEGWVRDVQGLSLRNVRAALYSAGKKQAEEFGEMMFTHFGVTGPIILRLSRRAAELMNGGADTLTLNLNLKPALSYEVLHARIERDFSKYERKQVRNGMIDLLPKRLIDIVLGAAQISPERTTGQVSTKERNRLAQTLQALLLARRGDRDGGRCRDARDRSAYDGVKNCARALFCRGSRRCGRLHGRL